MSDKTNTGVLLGNSGALSIVAIIFALSSLGLDLWQSYITLRPIVALDDQEIYEKTILPNNKLGLRIKFVFENRGESEIRGMEIRIAVVVDNKQREILESDVSNDIFPHDVFNRTVSMQIPESFFDFVDVNSLKLRESLYFKIVVTYKKFWFGQHKQVFYVMWSRETNRFEHCNMSEASIIDKVSDI